MGAMGYNDEPSAARIKLVATLKYAGLIALALVTAVACYLAITH